MKKNYDYFPWITFYLGMTIGGTVMYLLTIIRAERGGQKVGGVVLNVTLRTTPPLGGVG